MPALNALNIPNEKLDDSIYRIMPVERLFEILDTRKMTLVRPEMWGDPFENLLLNGSARTQEGEVIDFTPIRESVFGQCWTIHRETDAMWRIYSPNLQGVKVRTTIRKLITALNNHCGNLSNLFCFIGKVEYLNQKKLLSTLKNINIFDSDGTGIARSLIYKRPEFKHEKEVRLIYTNGKGRIHQFTVDPIDLFDEIVLDPRMNRYICDAYTRLIKMKGFNKSVRQSVMYRPPKGIQLFLD